MWHLAARLALSCRFWTCSEGNCCTHSSEADAPAVAALAGQEHCVLVTIVALCPFLHEAVSGLRAPFGCNNPAGSSCPACSLTPTIPANHPVSLELCLQQLYDTFSGFGMVVATPKIMRDPDTGASRGFGFVSYDSFEASDRAIEMMHNQYLSNR